MLDVFLVAPPETVTSWTQLAQYGVLGLVVIGLVFGQIVPGYIVKRLHSQLDSKEAEIQTLRTKLEDQVIPVLVRTSDLMARLAERRTS